MKIVTLILCLCVNAIADLQSHTQKLTPQIREHLVMIGRLGLIDTRPGVVISKDGHILSPKITSIDGTDTPYLLYLPDGSRHVLETLSEPEQRSVALLKLPPGINIKPAPVAHPNALKTSTWFYLPALSPFPALNEPASVLLDARYQLEDGSDDPPHTFHLSHPSLKAGTPVFDLHGQVLGISLAPRRRDDGKFTRALLLSHLAKDLEDLQQLIPEEAGISTLDDLALEHKTTIHPATGLILNGDKQLTYSIAGTIIRSDGLILTKASELGPKLVFQHRGKKYPAALLATDSATDLAIVGVEARKLPVVQWASPSELTPGTLLYHQSLLGQASEDMAEMEAPSFATFSHTLPEHPVSIHHSSRITSLGIVPEQTHNELIISAIRPGSPAEKADLRLGDKLLQLDGQDLTNRVTLTQILADKAVGDELILKIERDGNSTNLTLPLSAASLAPETTGISVNEPQACVPSVVRGPFPETLVHTLPLSSWDCGAPLLDLNNQAHGIHIAAITSTRALALPPEVVKAAIERMMTSNNF